MTTIRVSHSNGITSVDIEGHAGYNPGNDIVCASISALACTLAEAIRNEDLSGKKIEIEEGKVHLEYAQNNENFTKTFNAFIKGFLMLEEAYPDYVKCLVENQIMNAIN